MSPSTSKKLVLASQSPRRRRLLEWLGVPYVTASVDTPEDLASPLAADPSALAVSLAVEKALAAHEAGIGEDSAVLCFDTIVADRGTVLGKPTDVENAWTMLRSLSGRAHAVVTGCAILAPDTAVPVTFAVTTAVQMCDLTDEHIREWMARGEYQGCAGAYNIEGQVAFVTDEECYQNVAGLPLCHLAAQLRSPALAPWVPEGLHDPRNACDAALCRTCRLGRTISGGERPR